MEHGPDHQEEEHRHAEWKDSLCFQGPHDILRAARNRALRALGFARISSGEAITGFFVIRVKMTAGVSCGMGSPRRLRRAVEVPAKNCLTIRSSSEWNEIIAITPSFESNAAALVRKPLRLSSSELTSMRMAWKVLVAGWILFG